MKEKIFGRVIIFDNDGTLTDTWKDFAAFMGGKAKEANLKLPPQEEIMIPFNTLLTKIGFSDTQCREIRSEFMTDFWQYGSKPFPGVPEMLRDLYSSGKILCLATGNSLVNIEKMLGNYLDYFSLVCTSDSDKKFMTKVKVFSQIKEMFPNDFITVVSDMVLDKIEAANAGMHFEAVAYGWELREGHKCVPKLADHLLNHSLLNHNNAYILKER